MARNAFALYIACALAALAVFGASAGDADSTSGYYDLAFAIEHEGEALGSPRLLVEPGEMAEIQVQSDDGRGDYRLVVEAERGEFEDGGAAIEVRTALQRRGGTGWRTVAEPRLLVHPGRPASLDLSGDGDGSAGGLSIELTARPLSVEEFNRLRREWAANQ